MTILYWCARQNLKRKKKIGKCLTEAMPNCKEKERRNRKFIPATFRPFECDQSSFPGGTWAPGPTTQLNTLHLGLCSWREGKSPLEGQIRQLPLEKCLRGNLSNCDWQSVPYQNGQREEAELEAVCRVAYCWFFNEWAVLVLMFPDFEQLDGGMAIRPWTIL